MAKNAMDRHQGVSNVINASSNLVHENTDTVVENNQMSEEVHKKNSDALDEIDDMLNNL